MRKDISFATGTVVGVAYALALHNIVIGIAIGAALAGVLSTRARGAKQDV